MEEFIRSGWGTEFVAGGVGGTVGVLTGHPLDTLRIRQQNTQNGSALRILRHTLAREGPGTLFRGMLAPLSTISFQNAVVFQTYATLSRAIDKNDPPSYGTVAAAGIGTGAVQTLLITPIELLKIRLQLHPKSDPHRPRGPIDLAKIIIRSDGYRGIFRGFGITILRDAPSHGVYFWTYDYMKELLHPGCRKTGDESFRTMVVSGGTAGVASWISCYPLDVMKTRIQAQTCRIGMKGSGMVDCYRRIVKGEGHGVLWRGIGTTVTRAFVVNGAVFAAYEAAVKCLGGADSNEAAIHTANAT